MEQKTCSRCREERPIAEFSHDKSRTDGHKCWCKDCDKEENRLWYQRNRKKERAKRRAYWPARREEKRQYDREHYQKHRERKLKYCAQYGEANRDKIAARKRQYRTDHRDEIARHEAAYRSSPPGRATAARRNHKRSLAGSIGQNTLSAGDWQAILVRFGHGCAYCGTKDVPLQRDHVVPSTEGGGLTKENVVPACSRCNVSKSSYDVEEWMASRAFDYQNFLERWKGCEGQ